MINHRRQLVAETLSKRRCRLKENIIACQRLTNNITL
jgi:hypothetical protein